MKKLLIGSFVAAILLFAWQSLSWTALHVHDDAYLYTSSQDTLLSTLHANLPGDGQYLVPRAQTDASAEEMKKMAEQMKGKPWAVITYHAAYDISMTTAILRGFLIALVCALVVCFIVQKLAVKSFGNVFGVVMSFAAISFFYVWYNQHNWFDVPWSVLKGELIDIVASWGLAGLWLGWWYSRKERVG